MDFDRLQSQVVGLAEDLNKVSRRLDKLEKAPGMYYTPADVPTDPALGSGDFLAAIEPDAPAEQPIMVNCPPWCGKCFTLHPVGSPCDPERLLKAPDAVTIPQAEYDALRKLEAAVSQYGDTGRILRDIDAARKENGR